MNREPLQAFAAASGFFYTLMELGEVVYSFFLSGASCPYEGGSGMLGRCLALIAVLAQLMAGGADLDSARAVVAMRAGILLRLHVVAASDLPEDQRIKLCVRDAVQAAYAEHAGESGSMLENTQNMLPVLQAAAEHAAREEGYAGPVTVTLEQAAFDQRTLDGLRFPAGIYPALMVRLGPAQGHNWWGLVDRELALTSAQVQDGTGTVLWEQSGVRWTLLLPELLCRWFGGEDAA